MAPFVPPPVSPPAIVMDAGWTTGTPAGTWPTAALPIRFVLARDGTRDVGSAIGAELAVALGAWALPSCSGFRATFGGVDARSAADDGVNVVIVHEDAWPAELVPGAVAQTVIHVDGSGAYRDADIHLNAVDYRFSLDAAPGTLDLRSVLVHEVGHALGLGHATVSGATMAASGSGLRWRSLEAADVAGVCALYPGTGARGCPDDACPGGFVCAARRCQRPGEATAVCAACDPETSGTCEAAGDRARCAELSADGPRACARPCVAGEDCGPGYTCRATSEAGDLQCVADDGCRAAGRPCQQQGDCPSGTCTNGVCLGASTSAEADGGATADGSADANADTKADADACACRSAPRALSTGPVLALVLATAALLARRSAARHAAR